MDSLLGPSVWGTEVTMAEMELERHIMVRSCWEGYEKVIRSRILATGLNLYKHVAFPFYQHRFAYCFLQSGIRSLNLEERYRDKAIDVALGDAYIFGDGQISFNPTIAAKAACREDLPSTAYMLKMAGVKGLYSDVEAMLKRAIRLTQQSYIADEECAEADVLVESATNLAYKEAAISIKYHQRMTALNQELEDKFRDIVAARLGDGFMIISPSDIG